MTYVTANRGHDAEFLLGQEMAFNQAILASGQRRGRKNKGERSPDLWLKSSPLTDDETATAAAVLRSRAAAAGIDDEAVAEVLDILGLTYSGPAGNPRSRVTCPTCGRSVKPLVSGGLPAHSQDATRKADDQPCPGTTPQAEATP